MMDRDSRACMYVCMCASFQKRTYGGEHAGKTEVIHSVQAQEMK